MATPNVTKKKTIRKKSLTYKAQVLSKELFCDRDQLQVQPLVRRKKNKKFASIKNKGASNTSWYCPACKKDVELSMRMCKNCNVWYNEVCMGLDSDDNEDFFCADCE